MGMDPVTVGLVVAAVVGAGASMNESHQQRKAQKTVQRNQRALQEKQEADALATRKQQINQMREQMNIGGYQTTSTQKTGSSPVKGSLGDTLG